MRFLNPSFLLSCAVLAGAGFSAASAAAEAQYPSQPITWAVGTSAGGASDVITRMVAKEMSALAGVPIIVDNRPGGATSIAASLVSRAAPDGCTLLWCAANLALKRVSQKVCSDQSSTLRSPI